MEKYKALEKKNIGENLDHFGFGEEFLHTTPNHNP